MEKTPHVLLAGQGANKFAREQGVPTLAPGALVSDYARAALEAYKKGAKAQTEIGDKNVCIKNTKAELISKIQTDLEISERKTVGTNKIVIEWFFFTF